MLRTRSLVLCLMAVWCLTTQQSQAQGFREEFRELRSDVWKTHLPLPHSGVEIRPCLNDEGIATGEVALRNRAYLFREYRAKSGSIVSTVFTWEEGGGGVQYADNFQLILRSSGDVAGKIHPPEAGKRSFEIMDGLIVRIDCGHGKVSLDQVIDGKASILASKYIRVREAKVEVFDQEPENSGGALALPEGAGVNWYKLSVDDDGKKLSISIDGAPVCSADFDGTHLPGTMLGIGNRESLAGFPMVTFVKSLSVMPIKR